MLKLLVHIENKILLSDERKVLILCNCEFEGISDWLEINYNVKVIKTDTSMVDNIVVVHAVKDEFFEGRTISIDKAISHLDFEEKEVEKYLYDLKSKGTIKLQYGLRDGKVLHISEITENERGLKCNCYCPGCGEKLQARLGKVKQGHFSHCGEHCNIESAQQTALHMMAKEIIEEELSLFIPGIKIRREEIYINHCDEIFWELPKEYKYKCGGIVKFDSVELEKRIPGMVSDIIVYKNGRPCLIEIAVTHFVDDEKLSKVKQLDMPMLEIDISSLYGCIFNKEQLKDAIISRKDNKKWIYNPHYESARHKAEEYYSRKIEELEHEKFCKEEAELRKELKREKNVQRARDKIVDLLKPENYKNKLSSLRNDNAFYELYKTFSFSKETKGEYPFFIDLPVKGEMIFNCDRRIWQGAIFDRFVYCGNNPNGIRTIVKYKSIKNWIKTQQKIFTINEEINRLVEINGVEHAFLYEAIIQYLHYLSYIGFICKLEKKQQFYMLERNGSVMPLKRRNAEVLKKVLSEVDVYSPDINEEIESLLYSQKLSEKNIELPIIKNQRRSVYDSVINKERHQLEEKNKLIKGFETIKDNDFSLDELIYDKFGTRWVKCKLCGKIKPSHLMGIYKFALGECSDCSKDAF